MPTSLLKKKSIHMLFKLTSLLTFCLLLLAATCRQDSVANCIDESLINPDQVCIQIYEPVCGCDNKTYGNECIARRSGVTTWTDGECPGDGN